MNARAQPQRAFGDWLRQRRQALDLSYEELARQVACSAVTLRKLEAEERRPSKQMAERLSAALQVALAERPAFVRFARGDPFAAPPESGPFLASAPSALAGRPRHNLPLQLTGFYGREDDIAHVEVVDKHDLVEGRLERVCVLALGDVEDVSVLTLPDLRGRIVLPRAEPPPAL